ncbi:PGF-pre-PGF domain-containing protein [Halorubrum sp. Atlit-28R]|uniref:PGF-pre-PGF domain-containing protein n=1 Tax=Halorubrum sp. Atlit-28R TaxID=2282129 RepID=UPI000EF26857|nr:PGF-pre-PGF domain-containing protein [Halorubrum sp. Atlit-28R]RLM49282.1 PGF-pre-PGF domain-containing protein [Halorubrum sp. Atlit-28R]
MIDGVTPYVSDVTLTNPTGQDLNVSFTTNERLNATTVELTGAETATFGLGDFTETNASGTYTYDLTYDGSSDGEYTVNVTSAVDAVGNDAGTNQTSAELDDSASVDTVPPGITGVEAEVGSDTVTVSFNESVESANGGGLSAANVTYGDAAGGGATGVASVSHAAGDATATLTLDAPVNRTDLGNDTIAAAAAAITDGAGNDAPTTGVVLADTVVPSAPIDATAGVVNASNAGSYDLTVDLPDDHEAGTVAVSLSNGGIVTASKAVASEDDGDADPDTIAFTGLDVSSLADGAVTVDATLTDDGGNDATGGGLASPTKDTDLPGVTDATITNATIGTEDAGVAQTVTVEFDEDVDQGVAPNVTVLGSNLNRTYDVTGSFDDARTWTGTVEIVDDNEAATATIRVANATDPAGNVQSPDESNSFEVDTRGPIAPVDTVAGNVTASNATTYAATVDLVSGSNADEVEVRVSDGTTNVTKTASTGGSDLVTVSGIDASSLADGPLTVTSRALDGGFENAEGFVQPVTVTKDTVRPGVASVSVGDGTVDDGDADTPQSVTITFDEDVDTSVAPGVTLTGLAQDDTAVSGSFADAQTWTGTVAVTDNDEEATATVEVSGVEDPVGNPQTPDPDTSGSVGVDTRTPNVTGFTATHDGTGTVEVSFESDESLASTSVSLDTPTGSTTLTPTTADGSAPYAYTATYDGADGDYTATLDAAADAAGNDGAAGDSDTATVDTTPPTFSAASPAGATVTTDRPEISIEVTDATRGVNASSVAVTVADADGGDGAEFDAATNATTGISVDGATLTVNTTEAGVSLADGAVDVTVSAADDAGNGNQTAFSFTVDTTPPQFSNAAPADETVTDDRSVVSVDVADATAGVDASTIEVTLSNDTDTILAGAGTNTDGVAFDGATLTVDPAGSGVPTLPNGSIDVTVDAADAAGNADQTAFSFALDTPPVVSGFSASDTGSPERDVSVSFSSSDELDAVSVSVSGAETATLSLADFSVTPDGDGFDYDATYEGRTDGTYDFTLDTADDGVTDGAAGQTASVLVDEAVPDVTVDAPNGGGLYRGGETVTVEWAATDNVTVTDDVVVEYSSDGGGSWQPVASGRANDGAYDWTVPDDDTTDALVRVSASDNSSNTGSDVSDGAFDVDSTPPTVESFSVSNPSGQAVTVAVETDEALGALSVDVSGASTRALSLSNFTETGTGPYTYEATFNDGTEGTYDATLNTAADAAGNDGAGGESDSVEVDTVTPTISDFSASNPSGQTVNVSFDASERLSATAVELETPSTTVTLSSLSETGSGPYTYTATYDEGADGVYNATLVTADDGLGNDGADGQTAAVEVDTTPPTLSNLSVTNPSGRQVRVHFDADEPIDTVAVEFSGPETASVSTDNPTVVDGSYVVGYTGNTDGEYTATVTGAVDAFGNDAPDRSGTVNVTTATPIISGFAASNPSGQNVTVAFGSDEPLANVTVDISGAESATLTEAAFATNGNTYTATYEGSSNGTYTAVLRTAADADGDDGASGQTNSVTVGPTDAAPAGPAVSDFSATSPADRRLRVSFRSDTPLADVGVAVSGPDATTLTREAFTEANGTYTATVAVDAAGDYTATLFEAAAGAGANGADGQSASVAVAASARPVAGGGGGPSGTAGGAASGGDRGAGGDREPTVSVAPTGPTAAAVTVEDAGVGAPVGIDLRNATDGPVAVADLSVSVDRPTDYSLSVSSLPTAAPDAPAFDGRAVGYLTVEHSMPDDAVTGATVRVRVDADRFADAAVDPQTAAVYRYHDGAWRRLETAVAARDDGSYLLRAETPGFSTFAVGTASADALRIAGATAGASTAAVGEPITVSATLVNDAGWRVDGAFSVVAGDEVVATRSVSVPPGSTVTTGVTVAFDEPGDYRLTVGNTTAGTLAVSAGDAASGEAGDDGSEDDGEGAADDGTDAESTADSGDASASEGSTADGSAPANATGSSDESVPGFGLPATLAALAGAAALARRRSA